MKSPAGRRAPVDRELWWRPRDGPGTEHVVVRDTNSGVVADGLIAARLGGEAVRCRYGIELDRVWATRSVRVEDLATGRIVELEVDRRGAWREAGRPRADLAGCLDVDIEVSPLTNTLPIRRLGLEEGDAREVSVAWVRFPSLRVEASRQWYTCLARRLDGALFRFESVASGFRAELEVDADGFVVAYEGLWTRDG